MSLRPTVDVTGDAAGTTALRDGGKVVSERQKVLGRQKSVLRGRSLHRLLICISLLVMLNCVSGAYWPSICLLWKILFSSFPAHLKKMVLYWGIVD